MKTLNLLLAGLIVLAFALTSCQKDNGLMPESSTELKTNDKDTDPKWIADPLSSYPNPFYDVTTIKYKVEESTKVKLIVYSPGNMNLTYLVDEYLRPGTYTAEFDATGLPAGQYIVHLRIGKLVFKEKMKKVVSFEEDPPISD